jgi:hypothetical protein
MSQWFENGFSSFKLVHDTMSVKRPGKRNASSWLIIIIGHTLIAID